MCLSMHLLLVLQTYGDKQGCREQLPFWLVVRYGVLPDQISVNFFDFLHEAAIPSVQG